MATQRSPKPRARGQVCGVFWFGSQVFGAARQQEAVSLQVDFRILLPFFLLWTRSLAVEPRQLSYAIGVAKPLSLFVGRPGDIRDISGIELYIH